MRLLLFLCRIRCNIKGNIFRVCSIGIEFDVVIAAHASKEKRAIIIDVAIGAFGTPVASSVNKVVVAQWPRSSAFAT